ncbi:unnamed protein product [Peniophora sp. CBMAI 1063]|nr:unnamed protein product [Peniophora sp. CBMAI 1063]
MAAEETSRQLADLFNSHTDMLSTRVAQILACVVAMPMVMAQHGPVVFPVDYQVWNASRDYNCPGSPTQADQFIVGVCANVSLYSGKFTVHPPAGKEHRRILNSLGRLTSMR